MGSTFSTMNHGVIVALEIFWLILLFLNLSYCLREDLHEKCFKAANLTMNDLRKIQDSPTHKGKMEIDPKDLTKGELCLQKCYKETLGIVKKGKFDMDFVKKDLQTLVSMNDSDRYVKCVENLQIKDCEDMRKYFQCFHTFSGRFWEKCAKENRWSEEQVFRLVRGLASNRANDKKQSEIDLECYGKCVFEKNGIIDPKTHKINTDKMYYDLNFHINVHDHKKFIGCIEKVEIKECDDLSRINDCKKL